MRWPGLLAFALSLAVALPAAAQDVARARQLFEQGLASARASHWVEARDAFQESLEIAERPSTVLNLAGAQVQTGQLVDAAASYRRFLDIARTGRDAAHRADAQHQLEAVEARIPHATLRVAGLASDDVVRIDERVVMHGALETPMALDPGPHALVVMREGRELGQRRFELADGESAVVELALVAPAALVATTEPPVTGSDAAVDASPPPSDDTGVWIGVGVGVGVAVAVGVVLGVVFATQGPASPYAGNVGGGVVHF